MFDSLLPLLLDSYVLLAVMGVFFLLYVVFSDDDPLTARVNALKKELDQRAETKNSPVQAQSGRKDGDLVASIGTQMRSVALSFQGTLQPEALLGKEETGKIVANLRAAGYYKREDKFVFLFLKFVAAIGLLGLYGAWVYFSDKTLGILDYILFFVAFLVGFQSIDYGLKFKASRRRFSIRRGFPDIVDVLLICVDSGMTFEAALQRICVEMTDFNKDVIVEMELTLLEMQYLNDRTDALRNLSSRLGIEEIKSFTTTVIQAEIHGTPVSEGLRVFAGDMRKNRLNDIEKWSAKIPTLLTIPMALFLLPIFFLVTLGPGVIRAMGSF